ncbi:MAG: OPT family oligopeptide transporter [Thermoguttaceae bacterium]
MMEEPVVPQSSLSEDPATAGHKPYVPDEVVQPEFTFPAVAVGAVLGIIFGASSLYLVLKVGMTVSASIPVAVLSITLFRLFSRMFGFRRATILENNIVQTTGSAGESIAFGVGVTMPAVMLVGFDMNVWTVMAVSVLGGALGILMMIPLRRAFIVKQHGTLRYPEGTACADVLIVGEQGGASAKTVFTGFGIAFIYQVLNQGFMLWKQTVEHPLAWFQKANPAIEVNPALLGVGYIIGTRISCIMVAGGVLASFLLIPAIRFFGNGLTAPLAPAAQLISQMSEEDIHKAYVLYIGAGAVATGGIISLFQALPLIFGSLKSALRDLRQTDASGSPGGKRTDRDLSLRFVGVGSLLLVLMIWATLTFGIFGQLSMGTTMIVNLVAALLIVLFGFLFVTVSSRLTGEIGSSSNPISGMTVATLLLTCLTFLSLDWVSPTCRLIALSIAAIVCIAASNGGTTSQDLKTGYLVGATPKLQQYAILVGSISSAMVIGVILVALNRAGTVYTARNLPHLAHPLDLSALATMEMAPDDPTPYQVWQALKGNDEGVPQGKYLVDDKGQLKYLVDPAINGGVAHRDDGTPVQKFKAPKTMLMAFITEGILTQKLPWTLVLLGVAIALVLELSGVPSLPFAVGVYLPLSSSTPIFVGGLMRYLADRAGRTSNGAAPSEAESEMGPGVLLATGYIAGGAICGVLIAFLSFSDEIPRQLSAWQYRQIAIVEAKPLEQEYEDAAAVELGIKSPEARQKRKEEIEDLASEIRDINEERLPPYVRVPRGTVLALPNQNTYTAKTDTTLGEIAREVEGSARRAALLQTMNADKLKMPEQLPVGAEISLPQRNSPAVILFSILAGLLLAVGAGWWLRGDS